MALVRGDSVENGESGEGKFSGEVVRQAGILCCSACIWTNFSRNNKIQRNYKRLK